MMLGFSPVLAADPLGFYIGAGVGHSQDHTDLNVGDFGIAGLSGPYSIHGSATGWKLMVGIRPLSILGAEVEYIDFGSIKGAASIPATPTQSGLNVTATSHPKAAALLAVGYLPIPLPYLDVFGKAGVAQLNFDVRATGQQMCPVGLPCLVAIVPPYSASGNHTRPAYGAGAQLKFKRLAVRAEYERISGGGGYADLLSFGVTFAF
jgi:opacity protein-like surface antigen